MSAVHSLRRRITVAFALIALCTALLFSGFAVLFMYTLEDEFFANLLAQETAHQQASLRTTGALAAPLRPYVSLHRTDSGLPADLRRQPGVARGGEFYGDEGRHYHVRPLAAHEGSAPVLLVAEVSSELVVRPRMPATLGLLGTSLALLLALTAGLGYWLARRTTRPLDELAALVGGAAPGQLPVGFSSGYPRNEIGALARALDEAMARLAAFIEREQHFTRDASHELRTPLACIEGAAFLLASEPMSPAAAQQLQRIRSAATQMTQAVDTLLALAREDLAQAGHEPVAMLPLAETTVVQLAHLLAHKKVEVEVDIAADVRISSSKGALAILLANLVSNAFNHSDGGTVRIAYAARSLSVRDDGPGIAPGLRQHLFEAGVKGAGSTGHGLGLSIARRLADRLGIGLHIENAAAGGTIATLTFPA